MLRTLTIFSMFIALAAVACDAGKKPDAKPSAAAPKKAGVESPKTTPAAASKKGAAPAIAETKSAALPFEATGPVARVNGKEISAERYNDEVRTLTDGMPAAMAGRYKDRVLDTLVTDAIVEAAFAAEGIKLADGAVLAEYEKFTKQVAKRGSGDMEAFFKNAKTSESKMKERMRKSLTFVALLEKKGHSVNATQAAAKTFYDKNPPRFTKREQVKASHILLKLAPNDPADKAAAVEKKAKEIGALAKAPGADFGALAKKHSEGPSGPKGGDLGFFEKNKMVPAFANAAWAMKDGDVSAPVKSQFGYHIIKVFGRKPGGLMAFADVKDQITGELENTLRRKASKAVIEELTKAAKVERLTANIKLNVPANPPPPPGGIQGLPPGLKLPKGAKLPRPIPPPPPPPPAPKTP